MFRNTRKHTERDELFSFPGFCFRSWLLFLQYSFQMLSCSQQKKECALTLVFMEYYYSLSNRTSLEGQLRCALDEFPWTTATKIAQVCCALFKIWQSVLRNSPVLSFCIPLILLFSFPDVAFPPLLFLSPKHAFRLHPNLQPADYFSFREKDLLFILEIITLQ